jgi:hypothetical protein
MKTYNLPLAVSGLTSYRYVGRFGYIMIGATDNTDALREAQRSLNWDIATPDKLQVWDGSKYVPVH